MLKSVKFVKFVKKINITYSANWSISGNAVSGCLDVCTVAAGKPE